MQVLNRRTNLIYIYRLYLSIVRMENGQSSRPPNPLFTEAYSNVRGIAINILLTYPTEPIWQQRHHIQEQLAHDVAAVALSVDIEHNNILFELLIIDVITELYPPPPPSPGQGPPLA